MLRPRRYYIKGYTSHIVRIREERELDRSQQTWNHIAQSTISSHRNFGVAVLQMTHRQANPTDTQIAWG